MANRVPYTTIHVTKRKKTSKRVIEGKIAVFSAMKESQRVPVTEKDGIYRLNAELIDPRGKNGIRYKITKYFARFENRFNFPKDLTYIRDVSSINREFKLFYYLACHDLYETISRNPSLMTDLQQLFRYGANQGVFLDRMFYFGEAKKHVTITPRTSGGIQPLPITLRIPSLDQVYEKKFIHTSSYQFMIYLVPIQWRTVQNIAQLIIGYERDKFMSSHLVKTDQPLDSFIRYYSSMMNECVRVNKRAWNQNLDTLLGFFMETHSVDTVLRYCVEEAWLGSYALSFVHKLVLDLFSYINTIAKVKNPVIDTSV